MGKSQKTLSSKVAQNGAELGVNENLFNGANENLFTKANENIFNYVKKRQHFVDQLELNAIQSGNSYS